MHYRLPSFYIVLASVALTFVACSTSEPSESPDAGVDDEDTSAPDAQEDTGDAVVELLLDDITPDEGSLAGGTEVTLGGQGFDEGLTAYFGDNEAEEVNRMGGLSAQLLTPASDSEESVDVTVVNPDGEEATVVDGFRYVEDDDDNGDDDNGDDDNGDNGDNGDENSEFESPEACNIQFPIIAEGLSLSDDDEITVFGRVHEPGFTDQEELPADLVAQALMGPAGADVDDDSQFTVVDAQRNPEYGEDDFEEFEATVPIDLQASSEDAITEAGFWSYHFRFSLDGGDHWTVCDIEGLVEDTDEVDSSRFGALEVFDAVPHLVHFCGTWTEEVSASSSGDGPTIDMEVYEGGITDDDFDGMSIEVEAGFGAEGTNPALGYQWTPIDHQGPVDGNENNAHFGGPLYTAEDAPDSGEYQALTRTRLEGEDAWRYCNTDDAQSDFLPGLVTDVVIEP